MVIIVVEQWMIVELQVCIELWMIVCSVDGDDCRRGVNDCGTP